MHKSQNLDLIHFIFTFVVVRGLVLTTADHQGDLSDPTHGDVIGWVGLARLIFIIKTHHESVNII